MYATKGMWSTIFGRPQHQRDARRRGLRDPDEKIWDTLDPENLYHDKQWGFYIIPGVSVTEPKEYEQWVQFFYRLMQYMEASMSTWPLAEKLEEHITFDVLEMDAILDIEQPEKRREFIRQNFLPRLRLKGDSKYTSFFEPPDMELFKKRNGLTRYVYPIYVDQEVIDSVLNGEDPELHAEVRHNTDPGTPRKRTAFVKIIDPDFLIEPPKKTEEEEPDENRRRQWNGGDHGYPAVEGCRR